MTDQVEKARKLHALHVKGAPFVLYNIWDAGGAVALSNAGALAVGTGSWSMAAAHGFEDGEAIPFDFVLQIVSRIAQTVSCPVTIDFEGGFAATPDEIAVNVGRLITAGAVGINFEDQVVQGTGLNSIADQAARISAIRAAADDAGIPVFINARTDVFLEVAKGTDHATLLDEAMERQTAYAKAGADGFFVPGLTDPALIEDICNGSVLPVNVMMMGDLNSVDAMAKLGVSRVSYGPVPFFAASEDMVGRYKSALSS